MKKIMSLLTGALLVSSFVLVSCSGEAAKEATVSRDTAAELTYTIWDESQRGFVDASISEFNKTYPNIKITTALTPYKQYWAKLKTQAEANNLPDVFWMNGPNIKLYAGNDQLADLGGLDGVDWKNFPRSLVDLYSVNGKHYGVPKDYDTVALWFNKKLFAEAGVGVPSNDWTWDDVSKAALTISTKLKSRGIYGLTADMSGGQESFYNTIFQAGGDVVKDGKSGYGQPQAIKGLEFWSAMMKNGAMPTVQVMTDNPPNGMFTSGKAAMIYSGTWNTSVYAKDYANPADLDLVELPKGEVEGTVIHGLANVVAKNGKNVAAAKAFVSYLGTKQAADIEAAAGKTLPAFNGTQEKFLTTYPNWNLKAYTESAKNSAFPYPASKNTSAWANLEAEYFAPGFSGSEPVETSAKKLAAKMDELLSAEPK